MIVNPIIPVWLMTIICIILIVLSLYNKNIKEFILNVKNTERTERQKKLINNYFINVCLKILIIILLFVINLRIMIPNGDATALSSNLNFLFVIDTSYSMRALDYNGNHERFDGVINDCLHIIDEFPSSKYSLITFDDNAKIIIPFTNDTDLMEAELNAIILEDQSTAEGSTMNTPIPLIEKVLSNAKESKGDAEKYIIFFISDGEITIENEKLESYSEIKQYLDNGAVLGYGTVEGGKMVDRLYEDDPDSEYYYMHYYDDDLRSHLAISKLDEKNLKQIASDMGVDYINMSEQKNIDDKLKYIKNEELNSQSNEDKISSYDDIYYYFAIPFIILLIINYIWQKRRM